MKIVTFTLVSVFLFGLFVSSALIPAMADSSQNSGIIVVVKTNLNHYSGVEMIKVTGMLLYTPASFQAAGFRPNSTVHITITNPDHKIVAFAAARLHANRFNHVFVSGVTATWISGEYNVTAHYVVCYVDHPLCILYTGFTTFTYTA